MTADLLALLDQLDEAREAATPGPWENPYPFTKLIDAPGSSDNLAIVQADNASDAALIVAAVNAMPELVAALRGCLRWADQLDREALALGAMQHDLHKAEAAQKRDAAAGIRVAITAALAPEQVQS